MASFVLATSVSVAPGASDPSKRSGQLVEERQAGQRRGGQDDQLGALEGLGEGPGGPVDDALGEGGAGAGRRPAPGGDLERRAVGG